MEHISNEPQIAFNQENQLVDLDFKKLQNLPQAVLKALL
jgi:hypothetical protein